LSLLMINSWIMLCCFFLKQTRPKPYKGQSRFPLKCRFFYPMGFNPLKNGITAAIGAKLKTAGLRSNFSNF